jgi:hypothetical protein
MAMNGSELLAPLDTRTCSSPINHYPRTARPPCKPRGVVIVQGFLGHFANPWPSTERICGAAELSQLRSEGWKFTSRGAAFVLS